MQTHPRPNRLCPHIEVPQAIQPDIELLLRPLRSPTRRDPCRRGQSQRPIPRDERPIIDKRSQLLIDEVVDLPCCRIKDDLGGRDDVDVQWCFARLEFRSVGYPDAFGCDRCTCLLCNLPRQRSMRP